MSIQQLINSIDKIEEDMKKLIERLDDLNKSMSSIAQGFEEIRHEIDRENAKTK